MRRKKISKLVLKITDGVLSTLIDLVLLELFLFIETSISGSPKKLHMARVLAWEDFERFNSDTIKRAIKRAQSRGFIKQDFTLTKEGKERLEGILPKYFGKKEWNGNWYLVIYDIPEEVKGYRDALRKKLKKLGFGQLQASVWVCPFDFFGEIKKIVDKYEISPYVIFAISDRLGTREARILAEKVWNTEEINNQYRGLIDQYRELKKNSEKENQEWRKRRLYFEYLNILRQDPQLPRELLPEDWMGERAHQLFSKFKEN